MARWPKIVQDKPFVSLLAIAVASLVVLLVASLWGPLVGILMAILAAVGILLFTRLRRMREVHARAEADTFSFAEVNVRMRAKDRARRLIDAQRRKELLGVH